MSQSAVTAKPVDKDAANRREIVQTIKGPVVERLTKVIPALTAYDDPYGAVMASPDLLFACMQLIKTKRDLFQDLLVDEAGNAVADNETPLKCGRNLDQIIGMVVRSGAKAYSEKRFAPKPSAAGPVVASPKAKGLLDRLAELVGKKWEAPPKPSGSKSQADIFYSAIKDNLDYDWQVPLIPYFAELPVKLIVELGKGVTALHNPDAIAALADIGRHSLDQAKKILNDAMMREMLDTQPLAAKGIAFLGKDRYEFLHEAVYERMGENFWEMCVDCDRLEAMETQNAKDLEQMSAHLHLISGYTIEEVVRNLQFQQIPVFLDVARDTMGDEEFTKVFGSPGNRKVVKMFAEKIRLTPLDPSKDPLDDLRERLPAVFTAYLRDPVGYEKGL